MARRRKAPLRVPDPDVRYNSVFVSKFVKTRFLEPLMPVDEQIAAMRDFAPEALVGQTGGIYLLARELLRRGETYPLRWVVPTGASCSDCLRAN